MQSWLREIKEALKTYIEDEKPLIYVTNDVYIYTTTDDIIYVTNEGSPETPSFIFTDATVRTAYHQGSPKYPLITIDEQPTNEGVYVDGQPRIVTNIYQFEYYCQNTKVSDTIYTAEEAAKLLGIETDQFLNKNFNMTQIGTPFGTPVDADNNVYRWVVRYRAVIDTVTHSFWRNI